MTAASRPRRVDRAASQRCDARHVARAELLSFDSRGSKVTTRAIASLGTYLSSRSHGRRNGFFLQSLGVKRSPDFRTQLPCDRRRCRRPQLARASARMNAASSLAPAVERILITIIIRTILRQHIHPFVSQGTVLATVSSSRIGIGASQVSGAPSLPRAAMALSGDRASENLRSWGPSRRRDGEGVHGASLAGGAPSTSARYRASESHQLQRPRMNRTGEDSRKHSEEILEWFRAPEKQFPESSGPEQELSDPGNIRPRKI